jgi:hypothetical protein
MRTNRSLLTGLIIMTGATYNIQAQAQAYVPLVFGTTYVSAGADAIFGGDIVTNTYLVAGANTTVTGDIQTGTAITLGAGSTVGSDATTAEIKGTISGTATTLGATVVVSGVVNHGTAFTLGASASHGGLTTSLTAMSYDSGKVDAKQASYNLLSNPNVAHRNVLASAIPSDLALPRTGNPDYPSAGLDGAANNTYVYNAASLTTGAGITLTLDGPYHFVFNIADMLSIGAGTIMAVSSNVLSVTWNMGGYASVGAQAQMVGTVYAKGYVSTGVNSVMKGGLYSATSYVTIGASGEVTPQ